MPGNRKIRRRFTPTDQQPKPGIRAAVGNSPRRGTRPTRGERDEFGRLYDRVGDEAEALNALIEALLQGQN